MTEGANMKTSPLWRSRHIDAIILKGWKSLSPGLRGTSYPGMTGQTRPTLKGLHQCEQASFETRSALLWVLNRFSLLNRSHSLSLLLVALLTGCSSLGPRTIPGDRSEYS